MPDNEGFGILWMPEAEMEAAFDMAGAFKPCRPAPDRRCRARGRERGAGPAFSTPMAGRALMGARSRCRTLSSQPRSTSCALGMAMVVPPIFFAISAFLVGMVMSRIVALDRAEIGLLKALGYSDVEISLHYLLLAALIAVIGVALGWAGGTILARGMAGQYAEFFDFPYPDLPRAALGLRDVGPRRP